MYHHCLAIVCALTIPLNLKISPPALVDDDSPTAMAARQKAPGIHPLAEPNG